MEYREHFGKIATDKITGFTGVVTGFCAYITGCNQFCLTPKVGDNNQSADGRWIDENRIVILEGEQIKIEPTDTGKVGPGNGGEAAPVYR